MGDTEIVIKENEINKPIEIKPGQIVTICIDGKVVEKIDAMEGYEDKDAITQIRLDISICTRKYIAADKLTDAESKTILTDANIKIEQKNPSASLARMTAAPVVEEVKQ